MNLDDRIRQALHAAADPPPPLPDPDALLETMKARATAGTGPAWQRPAWFAGGAVVVAVAAGVLGALGVFGRPSSEAVAAVSTRATSVNAYDCPFGEPVRSFQRDDRVLVVARSGTDWLGVRDPADLSRVVWVPAATLRSDDGQPAPESLPAGECDTPALAGAPAVAVAAGAPDAPAAPGAVPVDPAAPAVPVLPDLPTESAAPAPVAPPTGGSGAPPAATPGAAPAGGPPASPGPSPTPGGGAAPAPTTTAPPPPAPPPDTQRPTFGNASAAPTQLCDVAQPGWATTSTLSAFVTDNVGVTSVTATWTGLPGSGVSLTKASATTWTATIGPFNGAVPSNQSASLTVTLTARDAAGNTASTSTGPVTVFDGGLCLF